MFGRQILLKRIYPSLSVRVFIVKQATNAVIAPTWTRCTGFDYAELVTNRQGSTVVFAECRPTIGTLQECKAMRARVTYHELTT
jgi:hypothetical protein